MTTAPDRLRFGLFVQPIHAPDENPTVTLEDDLRRLEHADALGFDEAWIGEHHTTGWEAIASPEVFIAAAAARTRTIRLGSGVVQASLHHPLHIAGRATLLDHLTRGRAMLGLGVGGGLPSDLHVFGQTPAIAQARFGAAFDAVMTLLTSTTPLTRHTDGFTMADALLQLRPYSVPHMPVAVVTSRPHHIEQAGRWGARVLAGVVPQGLPALWEHYARGAEQAGRTPSRGALALLAVLHLAPTREQALAEARTGATREMFDFKVAVNNAPVPQVPRDTWADDVLPSQAVIGTPDDAIAHIRAMQQASGGFGTLLLRAHAWASPEATRRSDDLFARYVMPHVNATTHALAQAAAVAARVNRGETVPPCSC